MKKILILCASILIVGIGYITWLYSRPEHYGMPFTNAPTVSIAELAGSKAEGPVQVEGEIVRQCPVSGCWFYIDDGQGHQFKVDLGKTLPQLPQRIGHRAKVEGSLVLAGEEPVLAGSAVEFR